MALRSLYAAVPLKAGIAGGGSDLPSYYHRRAGRCLNIGLDVQLKIELDWRRPHRVSFSMPPSADTALGAAIVERSGLLAQAGVVVATDAMPGWGLGCSSALHVGLQALRCRLEGSPSEPAAIAEEAWNAEAGVYGIPVGKQDHYASSFGGVNDIVFESSGVRARRLHLSGAGERLLAECLLIAGVGRPRRSEDLLARQDAGCRAGERRVLDAIARRVSCVPRFVEAVQSGDFDALAELIRLDWELKRRVVAGVYGDGVEEALEVALKAGAVAGRLLGAGSSGYLLLLTRHGERDRVRLACSRHFRHVRAVAPAAEGVRVWEADPR